MHCRWGHLWPNSGITPALSRKSRRLSEHEAPVSPMSTLNCADLMMLLSSMKEGCSVSRLPKNKILSQAGHNKLIVSCEEIQMAVVYRQTDLNLKKWIWANLVRPVTKYYMHLGACKTFYRSCFDIYHLNTRCYRQCFTLHWKEIAHGSELKEEHQT